MMIETGAHQVQANFVVHSDNLENLRAAFAKANKSGIFSTVDIVVQGKEAARVNVFLSS